MIEVKAIRSEVTENCRANVPIQAEVRSAWEVLYTQSFLREIILKYILFSIQRNGNYFLKEIVLPREGTRSKVSRMFFSLFYD